MGSAHEQSVKSWSSATVNGQVLQRVARERRELRDKARELKQIAAAIRAEQLRGELRSRFRVLTSSANHLLVARLKSFRCHSQPARVADRE